MITFNEWVGVTVISSKVTLQRVLAVSCAAGALLFAIVGCSNLETASDASPTPQRDLFSSLRNADLRPRPSDDASDRGTATNTGTAKNASGPWIFPGTERDSPVNQSASRPGGTRLAASEPGAIVGAYGVELNFDNADIQAVAKSVLGDVLGLNFIIDSRVQGTVTLASTGPIPRKDLLPVFESALRASNAAVVRDGNILKIVPLSETNGTGTVTAGAGEPGFGVSIVPLRYTSAITMARMAENFLSRPGALRADAAHNLVMVQGTTAEREAALDMITSFDIEWLHNQSVGVYPLKATTPDQMIRELQPIFENIEGGRGQNVIRFQPVTRMNAVMAVAKSPKVLEQATQWIQRLDRVDSAGTSLRTFRLKYGDAKQAVAILNNIFVGQSSSTADTARDQTAPGARTGQSRLEALGGSGSGAQTANSSTGATQAAYTTNTGGIAAGGGLGAQSGQNQNQNTAASKLAAAFSAFSDGKKDDADGDGGLNAQGGPGGVRGVLPNVRISADAANNAVVIYSNLEDYHIIERALSQIDRPKLQVAIEATVAEIELTDQLQFGVQYFLQSNSGSLALLNAPPASSSNALATTQTSITGAPTSAATAATTVAANLLSRVIPGFNMLLGSEGNPRAIINALATLTTVKVLSSPSIVAVDNQPAMLAVGDSIPIITSSATILSGAGTPVVNTIQMENTGVILKVLPHVHPNGTIQLEIDQEVSNVVNPNVQTLTPTISERHIHTTVELNSHQTVLLGGLISEQQQSTRQGIPVLQNLNWIGHLFGNTSHDNQRTEIIIFLTPRLIRNGADAQSVAAEFREKLDFMRRTTSVVDGPRQPLPVPR
jgi:general secretion pathway protein D